MNKAKIKHFFSKIVAVAKRHKAMTIVIAFIFFTALGFGLAALLMPAPEPTPVATQPAPKPQPKEKFYSPLTGLEVPDAAARTKPVTAIMLENSPDARPQSGLKESGVIYEAIAEGGITRFLVLYQQEKPMVVGPVRSLRMHFVDWLAPYNASIAHVGGSRAALNEVRNESKYRDIDEFFNGASYWRANDRYAPHNVYTSFERLDALNKFRGFTQSEFSSFSRVDGEPHESPNATKIQVKVSSPTYNSSYSYDAKTNTYARSQGGEPHKDREKGQITPSVVIAMKVNMQREMQDGYRENITTIGTGKAYIFQNGTVQEATWQKNSRSASIVFTDSEGKELPLVRGQTWITAVPNNGGNVTWQ